MMKDMSQCCKKGRLGQLIGRLVVGGDQTIKGFFD